MLSVDMSLYIKPILLGIIYAESYYTVRRYAALRYAFFMLSVTMKSVMLSIVILSFCKDAIAECHSQAYYA